MPEDKDKLPLIVVNGHRQRATIDHEFRGQASAYREEFNEILTDHLANGFSFNSFGGVLYEEFRLKVSTQTLYNWINQFPDFKLAKEAGESSSLYLYEKLLISLSTGVIPEGLRIKGVKKLNFRVIAFILGTRFKGTYQIQSQKNSGEQNSGSVININIEQGEDGI